MADSVAEPKAAESDPKASIAPAADAAPSGDGDLAPDPKLDGGGDGKVDPAPPLGADPVVAPKVEAKPTPPLWKAEKYDKVHLRMKELEAEVASLKSSGDKPVLTDADVTRRAEEMAATNEFNRRANEAAEAGKKAYPDFMEKIGAIREQVDPTDVNEQARYVGLVAAAIETGEAPRILYELGANPDRATELMKLPPVKLGMELAKMAAAKSDPDPSGAPKPMSVQVGGRGTSQEEITPEDTARADKLSTRTWIERRQKHVDEAKKRGERIW